MELLRDLRHALERKELKLVYQPKVEPRTGRVAGFEALLRWTDEELGRVSPDEFVALAEETGQPISRIGEDTRRDYWMGADEAVAYGLIDRVVRSASDL